MKATSRAKTEWLLLIRNRGQAIRNAVWIAGSRS